MATLTQQDVQHILDELYELDPSLKERDEEVRRVLNLMMKRKPQIDLRDSFIKELRSKVLLRITNHMKQKSLQPSEGTRRRWFIWPLAFATGGITIGLFVGLFIAEPSLLFPVGVPLSDAEISQSARNDNKDMASDKKPMIERLGFQAFGMLSVNQASSAERSAAPQGLGATAVDFSAVAAIPAPPAVTFDVVGSSESVDSIDAKMIAPEPYVLNRYEYHGEEIAIDSEEMDVYRRVRRPLVEVQAVDLIPSLRTPLVDLSSFGLSLVNDLSMSGTDLHGYRVSMNPAEGYISIDQEWKLWQDIQPNCQDEDCWKKYQLTMSDVPDDEVLIRTADEFLQTHRIDRSQYGSPVVDHSWRRFVVQSSDAVTDVHTVIYPLVIDGHEVRGASGEPYGLWVGVNIRLNRVSYVNNLRTNAYETSAYPVVTDPKAILDYAMHGGRYESSIPEGATMQTLKLGTPTIEYIQTNQEMNGTYNELYAPAFVFPVLDERPEDAWYWQERIVVPLVKELFEANAYPMPVPYAAKPMM